ncbi:MAG: ShlB/FhaC/HecB family hemolysin secretion/activation protein, partial [Alphaproteobacteria bacterium]|nr:ShlB/FhaC/HecB family hemolysin secretion/activation protein [Alphaproteobacteria bacterium]
MVRYIAALYIAVVLSVAVTPAMAQTQADINNAEQRSEQIMREQQLRQREDRERVMRSNRPPTQIEAPSVPTPSGQGEGCREISNITLSGVTRMSARKQEQIVAPYEGRCLGVAEIQALLSDITTFYIESGYATTRAYLPAQDLTTGQLRIDIVEGKVSAVEIAPDSTGRVNLYTAFPYLEGEVLSLRDIEQGLDQINRLSSNNATMDIVPGENVGESVIAVKNEPGKRWHAGVTGDNHGTRTTGRRQVGASLSVDNIFGLNDLFSLTERRTLGFNDKRKRTRSRSGMMSIPYGYVTVSGGYSWSDYNSTIVTAAGTSLGLSGDNRSVYGTVDYVALRTQDSKVTLSTTLTGKRARNYIGGTLLDVSSRNLT